MRCNFFEPLNLNKPEKNNSGSQLGEEKEKAVDDVWHRVTRSACIDAAAAFRARLAHGVVKAVSVQTHEGDADDKSYEYLRQTSQRRCGRGARGTTAEVVMIWSLR